MPRLATTVDPWAEAEFIIRARQALVDKHALLREVVHAYLVTPRQYPALLPDPTNIKSEHLSVRLPMFVADEVRGRAAAKGMSASRWKAALIQSHLMRAPVLDAQEIETLRASNYELRMIGINLNQIAHALNIKFEETDRIKLEVIEALIEKLKEHQQMVARLIRHSQNQWDAE